ncbi:MAG: aminoacyl-tRNA hydrolase [Actinomycetia bacterium]|nr:aminoacyl-tRNA hydrolase [Actinomycetes bacterium]
MALVVGLGNPGLRYAGTRHNIGFMVLDRWAKRAGFRFRPDGRAEVARHEGVYYLKPLTYMNLSGEAVGPFCRRYRIAPAETLVVVDDLDLPPGQLRIRPRGSSGGHNGLKSLIAAWGTADFPRLRVGIGRPPAGGDPVAWVLGRWPRAERPAWEARLDRAVDALQAILAEGLEAAMSRYNRTE